MQPYKSVSERRLAFFDADETLLALKSLFSFLEFRLGRSGGAAGRREYEAIVVGFRKRMLQGVSREELNAAYYTLFAGVAESEVTGDAVEWAARLRQSGTQLYLPGPVGRLKELQARGYEVFLVSGSFEALLAPFASELGASGVLCSRPEVVDGYYTGRLLGAPMIGLEKARAARRLMGYLGAAPSNCFACGDDVSDIPLLEVVGTAAVVGSQPELLREASRQGWQRL